MDETYAVCLKEDNKAIGSIGLMIGKASNIDIRDNEGEIGYWIGVPFWGQGLIPEACEELIRHGFIYHHANHDIHWKLMNETALISLDINPSIELTVNRFDRVIGVRSLNDEGYNILGQVNVKHKILDNAICVLFDGGLGDFISPCRCTGRGVIRRREIGQ